MSQKIEKLKFKYLFDKSYNPVYCTGGFGGLTPRNEIVLNFFMERHPIPYSETRAINLDGSIGPVLSMKPKEDENTAKVIRYVESGIIMDIQTAKEIRDWLNNNIEELEEQAKREII